MLIKTSNYFEYINKIGLEKLSAPIRKMHDLIVRITGDGKDWSKYQTYKSAWDKQFEAVELLLQSENKTSKPETKAAPKKESLVREHPRKTEPKKAQEKQPVKKSARIHKPEIKVKGKEVELVSPEVIFIKRFALLNGKEKNKQQVLNFIKAIQKAIVERKIRKGAKYSDVIAFMQKQLVNTYNNMKESIGFSFDNKDYVKYLKIAGAEHLMPSVRFIKAYIGMLGQTITKQRASNLFEKINAAIEKKQVAYTDKYMKHLRIVLGSLERFLKTGDSPSVSEAQLNGLNGVLEGCGCNLHGSAYRETYGGGLQGVEEPEEDAMPKHTILNSKQVVDLKQDKLDFTGKWLEFIGNPSRGFTAMIFGRPKFGKSYLALEFAGYLARTHGKVLYVAREEGFDDTLQQKIKDKNVAHDNLFVSDYLPESLEGYDFVFLDSVNKIGLSPIELDKLEKTYPNTSFIYVFQTTKDGSFRGDNEHQHNVDAVIEVPEKGLAVQYGRYNQGGQMQIFG